MEFFADKFKAVRQKKRFTIEQLSKEMSVTRATIWNWENEKRAPNETMIRKLAVVLEARTDEFSDIIPETPGSKELLNKPVQSFLLNAGPGEIERKKKFAELINIAKYFDNSLEQSSVVISAILDSMYSMCYIKDNSLQYIAANKAFVGNLAVNDGFVLSGKKDEDIFVKKEAQWNEKLDREVLKTGKPIIGQESFIPNTKKKKMGLITKQPIYDQNKSILGVVCIIVDITNRRAEEEKRVMLQKIIDNINIGVCFYNIKKNSIVYSNDAHEPSFLNIVDEKVKETVYEDDYKKFKKYLSIKAFPPTFDYRVIFRDQDMKWLKIHHSRVNYRGEDYLAFFEDDITRRKMNEEINAIVGASLDEVKLALCIVDIETKKMVYTNNYREELYGYPVSAFLGKNNDFWLTNCIHPEDRERLVSYENEFEYPEKRIFRIIRPDGSVRWIEAKNVKKTFSFNGKACLAFFDRDITEEHEKQKLNELFTESLNMVSDGVLIFDQKREKCLFVNKIFTEKTGYKESDLNINPNVIYKKTAIEGLYKDERNTIEIMSRTGEKFSVTIFESVKEISGLSYSVKVFRFV